MLWPVCGSKSCYASHRCPGGDLAFATPQDDSIHSSCTHVFCWFRTVLQRAATRDPLAFIILLASLKVSAAFPDIAFEIVSRVPRAKGTSSLVQLVRRGSPCMTTPQTVGLSVMRFGPMAREAIVVFHAKAPAACGLPWILMPTEQQNMTAETTRASGLVPLQLPQTGVSFSSKIVLFEAVSKITDEGPSKTISVWGSVFLLNRGRN